MFSRYPAWMCEALAVFFVLAASHCVDDMIGIDPSDVVASGWHSWLLLARRCGWEIRKEQSPFPSNQLLVIGVTLDTSGTPDGPARFSISETRNRPLVPDQANPR